MKLALKKAIQEVEGLLEDSEKVARKLQSL
jgi:hypothetical protein